MKTRQLPRALQHNGRAAALELTHVRLGAAQHDAAQQGAQAQQASHALRQGAAGIGLVQLAGKRKTTQSSASLSVD